MPVQSTSKKTRSRAYPCVDLGEAVELLRVIDRRLGRAGHDREGLAKTLGYSSSLSGTAGRKIAALGHFGLLDRSRRQYRPSRFAVELLDSSLEESRRSALLRDAFLAPKIFAEIFEKYRGEGRIPEALAEAIGQFGITDSAREHCADVFLASGRFARLLDENHRIVENVTQIELGRRQAAENLSGPAVQSQELDFEGEPLSLKLVLSHGSALLQLPRALTEADVQLLKLQIDVLAKSQSRIGSVIAHPSSRRP